MTNQTEKSTIGMGDDAKEMREQLTRNAWQCSECNDIVESKSVHDFRKCSCGALAVDGGLEYSRLLGRGIETAVNLCEFEMVTESDSDSDSSDLWPISISSIHQ